MRQIKDAVKHHDPAALKKLFSVTARKKATDLDTGLDSFLSFFPSGEMTWKPLGFGSSENAHAGKRTVELFAGYKVSAGGKQYDLYFTEFTVNEASGVGIYSLGITPYVASSDVTASGKPTAFGAWKASFAPGIYVPKK